MYIRIQPMHDKRKKEGRLMLLPELTLLLIEKEFENEKVFKSAFLTFMEKLANVHNIDREPRHRCGTFCETLGSSA